MQLHLRLKRESAWLCEIRSHGVSASKGTEWRCAIRGSVFAVPVSTWRKSKKYSARRLFPRGAMPPCTVAQQSCRTETLITHFADATTILNWINGQRKNQSLHMRAAFAKSQGRKGTLAWRTFRRDGSSHFSTWRPSRWKARDFWRVRLKFWYSEKWQRTSADGVKLNPVSAFKCACTRHLLHTFEWNPLRLQRMEIVWNPLQNSSKSTTNSVIRPELMKRKWVTSVSTIPKFFVFWIIQSIK